MAFQYSGQFGKMDSKADFIRPFHSSQSPIDRWRHCVVILKVGSFILPSQRRETPHHGYLTTERRQTEVIQLEKLTVFARPLSLSTDEIVSDVPVEWLEKHFPLQHCALFEMEN